MSKAAEKITPFKDGRRRRMKWTELSAVAILPGGKRGANPEANMVYMKSKDKGRKQVVDAVTGETDGHVHGIKIHVYDGKPEIWIHHAKNAKDEESHTHSLLRTDDGGLEVVKNAGHSHSLDESKLSSLLLARVAEALKEATDAESYEGALKMLRHIGFDERAREPFAAKAKELGLENWTPEGSDLASFLKVNIHGEEMESEMTEAEKQELEQAKEAAATAGAELKSLKAVLALSADQRAHYDGLDEAAKESFLALDDAAREGAVAKAAAEAESDNPVVFKAKDGTEYRKNDGERVIELAKAADASQAQIDALTAAAKETEVSRRAQEIAGLPGDAETHKALVLANDAIEDEDLRGKAWDALKAQSVALSAATKTVGVVGAPDFDAGEAGLAYSELEKKAKERAENSDGKLTFEQAFVEVSEENPELADKAA